MTASLANMTDPRDVNCAKTRPDMRFHAIYKTAEGKDYCREPLRAKDYADACNKAQTLFSAIADATARRVVIGFAIECW